MLSFYVKGEFFPLSCPLFPFLALFVCLSVSLFYVLFFSVCLSVLFMLHLPLSLSLFYRQFVLVLISANISQTIYVSNFLHESFVFLLMQVLMLFILYIGFILSLKLPNTVPVFLNVSHTVLLTVPDATLHTIWHKVLHLVLVITGGTP